MSRAILIVVGRELSFDFFELTLNHCTQSRLKAGTVVTIEPGIYVPPTPNFPKHFHNIGIRIEVRLFVPPCKWFSGAEQCVFLA